MLINHPHQFVTNAKAFVESNTLVEWDCCDVDSLPVLVPIGNKCKKTLNKSQLEKLSSRLSTLLSRGSRDFQSQIL